MFLTSLIFFCYLYMSMTLACVMQFSSGNFNKICPFNIHRECNYYRKGGDKTTKPSNNDIRYFRNKNTELSIKYYIVKRDLGVPKFLWENHLHLVSIGRTHKRRKIATSTVLLRTTTTFARELGIWENSSSWSFALEV